MKENKHTAGSQEQQIQVAALSNGCGEASQAEGWCVLLGVTDTTSHKCSSVSSKLNAWLTLPEYMSVLSTKLENNGKGFRANFLDTC